MQVFPYTAIHVMYSLIFTKSSDMLNKNTYGAKRQGQSEVAVI